MRHVNNDGYVKYDVNEANLKFFKVICGSETHVPRCPEMSQDVPRLESTSLSQSDSFMGSDLPIRLHGLFGSQLSHHWLLFSCDPHGHGQHILLVPVEGFGVRHLSFAKPNNDYKQQL